MLGPNEAHAAQDPNETQIPPEWRAVGRGLQQYYQIHAVGPTPARLQMLLNELMRRGEIERS
jgi:hypothetical protein